MALALLAMLALAGCSVGTHGPRPGTVLVPRQVEVETHAGGATIVLARDPATSSPGNVRVTLDPPEACYGSETNLRIVWLTIWNRTGVAYYQQYADGSAEYRDGWAFEWPADPPYLLKASSTCFADIHLQYTAIGDPVVLQPAKTQPLPGGSDIVYDGDEWVKLGTVVIPPGQLVGETVVEVGRDIMMDEQWTFGTAIRVVKGAAYGTFSIYPPRHPTTPDHWMVRTTIDPLDTDWQQWYPPTGIPGPTVFRVELAAPSLEESVWEGWGYPFLFVPSALEQLGFQQPFRVYAS